MDAPSTPSTVSQYASLAGIAEEAAGPLLTAVSSIPDVQKQIATVAAWVDNVEKKIAAAEATPEGKIAIDILKRLFPNEWP